MVPDELKFLLITANVGSIFEDMEKTLKQWLRKCLKGISRMSPAFVAIHCQEVGGKNYEESMHHVEHFVKTLLSSAELQKFDKARIFLDEDFTAEDKFTALGSFYFIHESIKDVEIWNYAEQAFIPLQGKMVHSGNIENVPIKEKLKFPFHFFPECQWSRKGYMRTRWRLANRKFDLVNIHLFHDASNLTALETSPSSYSQCREVAFKYVLDRFESESTQDVPRFIFGDFNFRLDSHQLVKSLLHEAEVHKTTLKKTGKLARLQFKNADEVLLTVESKLFEHRDHEQLFLGDFISTVLQFDYEPNKFKDRLFELPILFPPSYPFSEDADDGRSYMKTRCPSWCDRILMNASAKLLVQEEKADVKYYVIGDKVCMGDHKPVFLSFSLSRAVADQSEAPAAGKVPSSVVAPCAVVSEREHSPLSRMISINGEEVDASDLHTISILCNATFENEATLSVDFRMRLDRKAFKDIATNVVAVANVVRRWKGGVAERARRRRHSSSVEEGSDEERDTSDTVSAEEVKVVAIGAGKILVGGCGLLPVETAVTIPAASAPVATAAVADSLPEGHALQQPSSLGSPPVPILNQTQL